MSLPLRCLSQPLAHTQSLLCLPHAAGPYTSFDINTLLKNTAGTRQDVSLSLKDDLMGETSRIAGELCALSAACLASHAGMLRKLPRCCRTWHRSLLPPPLHHSTAVAEAIVQLLPLDFVEGKRYSIGSKEGDGPGQDAAAWRALFASVR